MAATVVISERNGSGTGTPTSNVTNVNMGSIDSANVDPVANYLASTSNSFEKYHYFEVTAWGASSQLTNFKIWDSGAPATGATMKTNLQTATPPTLSTYTQPVSTASAIATQTMPVATPGTNNLGGSITNGTNTVSNYIVSQLQLSGATAGSTITRSYQYDEIA